MSSTYQTVMERIAARLLYLHQPRRPARIEIEPTIPAPDGAPQWAVVCVMPRPGNPRHCPARVVHRDLLIALVILADTLEHDTP